LWRIHKLGEKPRRSWQEAVKRWLLEKQYKRDIEGDKCVLRWLDPYFRDKYLDEITRDLIDEVAAIKLAEGVTPTRVNRYLALIRAVLRKARDEWEWIDKAPHVQLFPEPSTRVKFLTREQAARLVQELPDHLADMVEFSLATGLRQKNVRLLQWEQVSLECKKAWVEAHASKSGRAISVPLSDQALRVLRRRKGRHPKWVFALNGKPVYCPNTRAWRKALKRAGIEGFRWHDLRHTWASWHVQSGTSLQELMELGGWSSYQMVLRYAHLGGDHLLEAANRISVTNWSQKSERKNLKSVASN
jgi:integrase